VWESGGLIVGRVMVLAEGQVFIRIEFDEMVGPEGVARAGGGSGRGCGGVMRVVGEGGLVSQGSLEEPVGGVGLAGTTDLAAPEAAEL
jgi:hypothetical protein